MHIPCLAWSSKILTLFVICWEKELESQLLPYQEYSCLTSCHLGTNSCEKKKKLGKTGQEQMFPTDKRSNDKWALTMITWCHLLGHLWQAKPLLEPMFLAVVRVLNTSKVTVCHKNDHWHFLLNLRVILYIWKCFTFDK